MKRHFSPISLFFVFHLLIWFQMWRLWECVCAMHIFITLCNVPFGGMPFFLHSLHEPCSVFSRCHTHVICLYVCVKSTFFSKSSPFLSLLVLFACNTAFACTISIPDALPTFKCVFSIVRSYGERCWDDKRMKQKKTNSNNVKQTETIRYMEFHVCIFHAATVIQYGF